MSGHVLSVEQDQALTGIRSDYGVWSWSLREDGVLEATDGEGDRWLIPRDGDAVCLAPAEAGLETALRTPTGATPPSVPGAPAGELARMALRAVVEHWPGDLRGVSLRAEPLAGFKMGATVALLAHEPRPMGLLLEFSARELREGSRAVEQRVRREHRDWARVT